MPLNSQKKENPPRSFKDYPGSHIIDQAKRHVAETGVPTSWEYHTHTKPPKKSVFRILAIIEIPSKFRGSVGSIVGKSPCPICSPNSPKYFEGMLAWFYEEGVLRFIGRECATKRIGGAESRQADREFKQNKAREDAYEFLFKTLPTIAPLKAEVIELSEKALLYGGARKKLFSGATQVAWKKLCKEGADGSLPVYQWLSVTHTDSAGNSYEKNTLEKVDSILVRGLDFFKNNASIEAMVNNTNDALDNVHKADTPNSACYYVADNLTTSDELLFDEVKNVKFALKRVEELRSIVRLARSFFVMQNLSNLNEWFRDQNTDAPMNFRLDSRNNIIRIGQIHGPTKPIAVVSIPSLHE